MKWILPILNSPMNDQGFDISDFKSIREDLGGNNAFIEFIKKAHEKNIRVVFDVAINHTSSEHFWFKEARKSKNSKYRNYYIWNEDTNKYTKARLLFEGMEDSNWAYNEETNDYYFHRFYKFQPDLNYKNPKVLIEMIKNLMYWREKGVDGFRMDAAPFLWKEEGTLCENLPQTHKLLKIFRKSFDYVTDGTKFIAEANLEPKSVVEYFGDGDECNMAYNFPLMPKFYLAVKEANGSYIINSLKELPKIPKNCEWLNFLRCHDELTLEFSSELEREKMNKYFLKNDLWKFRNGLGIAGRIYNLFEGDVKKILLIHSLMFSVDGVPIIYYGDEIGQENDLEFYNKMKNKTGYADSRYLNRGILNTKKLNDLKDKKSDTYKIFNGIKDLIKFKKYSKGKSKYSFKNGVFISEMDNLIVYNNLTDKEISIDKIKLGEYEYKWVKK